HFVSLKVSASSSVNAVHKSCLRSFPAFIFNDTPTTVIYTLSLHDALPISVQFFRRAADRRGAGDDAHAIGQLQLVERVAKLVPRSEEHTSELQSRFDLVCRLLLEKKNPCIPSSPCGIRCTS